MTDPNCLACGQPLAHCAARYVLKGGLVTPWESRYVCHNRECALFDMAFRKKRYQWGAKAALRRAGLLDRLKS